ncbi:hypothetical protein EX30DRAFT_358781 [Ascodesmis nigricans]|uniref:Uncharacterized protein n=1 Tax=Ascodesmis nigricans TaxID=341454 RepID=A0A4S2MXU7_9PEZI|nr:hypothetical protein EX30DRAFT_358781 [Ascodesmis nigricans]
MDFAPYQSEPPDNTRKSLTLSRPMSPPQTSRSPPPISTHQQGGYQSGNGGGGGGYIPAGLRSPTLLPVYGNSGGGGGGEGNGGSGGWTSARMTVGQFETSLPLRLDVEAALTYLLLPPAIGVFLLIVEHKSDYVRFHAWQSSIVYAVLIVLHLLLSWSSVLSWGMVVVEVVLGLYMAGRAWRDAETLDRCELPWVGEWASGVVDNE